ncbi:hypothetical protein O181_078869 [Austropuccinia psidii MF-1]|uniref:Cyclin-like domain-containing protein n=1 Tax=Austropuccinia psidii MF-1 TaxID=1389203 RepID=A0A9Q3IHP7_9BASI|nr:hypothetical protein [Austropuccinia psidii MF-1]
MSSTQILRNPLADPLERTPSSHSSISSDLERELRFFGGLLIQQAGILLNLPQIVMATAATLFQRFYFVTSFLNFGIRDVSAGCLFLASKLEEKSARIRDIINVYDYLLQLINWSHLHQNNSSNSHTHSHSDLVNHLTRQAHHSIQSNPILPPQIKSTFSSHLQSKLNSNPSNPSQPSHSISSNSNQFHYTPMNYFSQEFFDRKEAIVVAEMQILKRLGFHVQVQHPYSAMVNYLQVLNLTDNLILSQRAWSYLNDSLLTPLPALYPPTHLATMSIYMAANDHQIQLPETWWELFDISQESELETMSSILANIYSPSLNLNSSQNQKESIWLRVSKLPISKEGVRDLIETLNTQSSSNPS